MVLQSSAKAEVEIEANYYGLKDHMFCILPIPHLVKAAPTSVETADGYSVTVTQDDAGLWYMDQEGNYDSCLVTVCDGCGWGQPSCYVGSDYCEFGVPAFTTGRTITAVQPRKTEPCTWDGEYCASD